MTYQLTNILSIIVLLAFAIRTVRNTLYHLFLWQAKEYRLDRMLVHLRIGQGKKLLFGPLSSAKTLLLIVFILSSLSDIANLANLAIWIFSALIVYEALRNVNELITKSLPLPIFSIKTILIFLIVFLFQILWLVTSASRLALDYLPFLDKFLGLSIAGLIGIFSIPARFRNIIYEFLAKEKIQNLPNLKVIGITGSYGKTSTKEFIYQLLSAKYKTAKTQANQNTLIGVSQAILNNIENDTKYFVMEAAAYKKGEIKRITNLVGDKLEMVVITGLNQQHLDLFGTLEKIAEAKYELVQALKLKKTAIFNANNTKIRILAKRAKKDGYKVLLYGYKDNYFASAASVKQTKKGIKFTANFSNKKTQLAAPIVGIHNIENILPAILIADSVGISIKKITSCVKKLKSPPQTMSFIIKGKNTLIDDTYNANPNGVEAALNYLKIYKEKKVLVLQPLIELGTEVNKAHAKLAKLAVKVCDLVILTNSNFNDAFIQKQVKDKHKEKIAIKQGRQAKDAIEKLCKGKKVILFEGKEAEKVLKEYV